MIKTKNLSKTTVNVGKRVAIYYEAAWMVILTKFKCAISLISLILFFPKHEGRPETGKGSNY